MIDIYDPERLLAQAAAWRAAAEKAPPNERDIYLSQALDFETRVERSINTPVLKDRSQVEGSSSLQNGLAVLVAIDP